MQVSFPKLNLGEWDLPNIQCRAQTMGISEFAECLCRNAGSCPYSLRFGYGFLCFHPQRERITDFTEALKN